MESAKNMAEKGISTRKRLLLPHIQTCKEILSMMVAPSVHLSPNRSRKVYRLMLLCLAAWIHTSLFASGEWKADLKTVRAKAAKGDVYYQGLLGIHLKHGGPEMIIDLVESERWSAKAAEKNGAFGLCNLASLEMRKRNYEKGRFLYDEAHLHSNLLRLARAGDAVAIFCLGLIELESPPRNIPKAIRHLEKSGSKGFAPAQAILGMLQLNGIGIPRDRGAGIKWLQAAARSESAYGQFHLGMAYSIGEGVAFNQPLSMQLIRKAADQGLASAQLTLGMKYSNGEGVDQDYAEAANWFQKASNQGSGEATFQLRRCLTMLKNQPQAKPTPEKEEPAVGVTLIKPNPVEPETTPKPDPTPTPEVTSPDENTKILLQQARHLLLVEKKISPAKKILSKLATKGIPEAQRLLGIAHYRSLDYKEAHEWLLKAAEKNDPQAQRYLGMIYFLGQGIEKDYAKARTWLSKASAQGDQEATRYREILEKFYQE